MLTIAAAFVMVVISIVFQHIFVITENGKLHLGWLIAMNVSMALFYIGKYSWLPRTFPISEWLK